MTSADFLVIGGGIAGLSAAARLAAHGRVVVLEAEDALGHHSSGRSATFAHYGIGNAVVRGLTACSRGFFTDPPDDLAEVPLARPSPALFVATEPMQDALTALAVKMCRFTDTVASADDAAMLALCPVLRLGPEAIVAGVVDTGGLRLDADALLQGFGRAVRRRGGNVETGVRVAAVARAGSAWTASTADGGRWSAPVLVNAAGAWADGVARLAGVQPLGLTPLRRTIIVVDPPAGVDPRGWPFVKSAIDEFYMLPDGGRLLASPVDEVPDEPGDAQPEEYDVALAANRLEQYTTLNVRRVAHRWAGLRTFAHDRVPVAGFAPDAPGFFWLAGQGGFGLQTAPAMAAIAEALVTGAPWPAELATQDIDVAALSPGRFG